MEAYLFGSRARGDSHAASDIDVAVYTDSACMPDSPFGYQSELTAALMSALQANDIDVLLLNNAPPLLYHRVLRDGIRLFARRLAETTSREARALSRYCDYLPQLRKIEAAQRARLASGAFGR